MRFVLAFCLGLIAVFACNKPEEEEVVQTYYGPLPIVRTTTPASVAAGQNIVSSVRCELYSLGGSIQFQGFDIQLTAPRQYAISANALYKDWNTLVHATVIWSMEGPAIIPTKKPGTYILRFYNNTQIVKVDTVQVI
jgi:hypothetical protein